MEDKIKKRKEFHNLADSEIRPTPPIYKSKSFYIRYKDETVVLDEICQFRSEMDAEFEHNFSEAEYFLEATLRFKKLSYTSFDEIVSWME